VFPKYRAVVFVNGCFWHAHECDLFRWPSSRPTFWKRKLLGNRQRDSRVRSELADLGWRYLVVWECSLKHKTPTEVDRLVRRVGHWIRAGSPPSELPAS
jgi:DNA mismatch endonuclease (patch repair protein)